MHVTKISKAKSLCLWFSRKNRDYSSYELNYTEVLRVSVHGFYCPGEISRPHGARFLTSFESRRYMPVIKQHKLVHLKTTFNDALKKFIKFRLQTQKENSITKKNGVCFTFRRRPTPNYHVWCVTRQYLFRIHFVASKSLSECPAYLYSYMYLLLSSFSFQMQVVRRSLSLSIKIIYD